MIIASSRCDRSRRWLCLVSVLATGLACLLVSHSGLADYVVQVGAYTWPAYAREKVEELEAAGFPVLQETVTGVRQLPLIQVLVGPYSGFSQANSVLARLKARRQTGFVRNYQAPATESPQKAAPVAVRPPEQLEPAHGEPDPQKQNGVTEPPPAVPADVGANAVEPLHPVPESFEALFGVERADGAGSGSVTGFLQSEIAYTTPSPEHLSKFRNILELGKRGTLGPNMKWKLSGRAVYDAVFDIEDFFPDNVKDDQRFELDLRETYLDYSKDDWDFRIGRQHIIWGEVVGLFFADVVSAKDLREPTRSDLDMLRIPQWATRAEYFRGDFHADAIWIPYMTYDELGEPGGEFYPQLSPLPGFSMVIEDDVRPDDTLSNSAYGLRFSYLGGGWDSSIFYYSSMDVSPAFERIIVTIPSPVITYRPIHERIDQLGITYAKDFKAAVLKAEAIYTKDKLLNITRLSDPDGLVPEDALDFIVSLEFSFPEETRLNLQYFEQRVSDPDPDLVVNDVERGATLFVSTRVFDPNVETEMLLFYKFENDDWLFEPKLTWRFRPNWRLAFGANIFNGPETSQLGQYDDKDQVFTELHYSF